jgi:uncharacterized phage protein gp47/JayE
VSFIDRPYPDIVRDILTNVTQGITGEPHRVDYDPGARPIQVPDIVLLHRPVKRVSAVNGFIAGATADDPPRPYAFSLNDYELIHEETDPTDVSRIRFLPFGRKPAAGTVVQVNYYPRTTEPVPVNDVNVGSVVRTFLEAVSKELGIIYAQLNLAYDSAFLDTATGPALDRVVALLGYQRFGAGRAVGKAVFSRRSGAVGDVVIPAGTPITDTADKVRYETAEPRVMLAGETTAEIAVRGASVSTPTVDPNVLTVIQRAIAGVDSVTNPRPSSRATDDESDEDLRARARDALIASNKGTVGAMRNGLFQLPEVRDVRIEEMPNGLPGEVRLTVSLAPGVVVPPGKVLPDPVLTRIEELRPAGIRVLKEAAAETALAVNVTLTLAGGSLPQARMDAVVASVKQTLKDEIARRGVGEKVRVQPLVAALLRIPEIVDASLAIQQKGGAAAAPGSDFTPAPGSTVSLAPADISIAPPVFDQPPPAVVNVAVEVRARFKAQLTVGTTVLAAQTILTAKLSQFFDALPVDAQVDSSAILTAVRDDTKYGLDPLGLAVTLTSAQQFFQIVQGGPGYRVLAGQKFSVASVEVTS